jgi:hypothetical protein
MNDAYDIAHSIVGTTSVEVRPLPGPHLVRLVYEIPSNYGHPADGKGDIIKLAHACGMLVGYFAYLFKLTCPSTHITPVTVADWKGNAPKDVMCNRIKRKCATLGYKPSTTKTHELDAIGIGFYALTILGKGKA